MMNKASHKMRRKKKAPNLALLLSLPEKGS
jgi:hypothetical protein